MHEDAAGLSSMQRSTVALDGRLRAGCTSAQVTGASRREPRDAQADARRGGSPRRREQSRPRDRPARNRGRGRARRREPRAPSRRCSRRRSADRATSTPPSNSLLGERGVDVDDWFSSTGVRQRLPWGSGTWSVSWDTSRTTTNSPISSFDPSLQSGFQLAFSQPLLKDRKIDAARQQYIIAKRNQRELRAAVPRSRSSRRSPRSSRRTGR